MTRAVDRVGRRGFVLGVLGLASIARGFTVMSGEAWDDDSAVVYNLWPDPVRMSIWLAAGTIALLSVRHRQLRDFAFGALSLAITHRLVGHLWSWLMWAIPGAPGGDVWAWAWVAWWGSLLWLLWLIARWTDEGDPTHDS